MVRSNTVLALCDPEPFTVATCMLKSLTTGSRTASRPAPCTAISVVAIHTPYYDDPAVGRTFHYRAVGRRRGTGRCVLRWVSRGCARFHRLEVLRDVAELVVAAFHQ